MFERHYVLPTCTPTRVGLMTGRYPSRYGVLSPAYGQIFDLAPKSKIRTMGNTTRPVPPHTDEPFRFGPPGIFVLAEGFITDTEIGAGIGQLRARRTMHGPQQT